MKINAVLIAALLSDSSVIAAQSAHNASLLQKAHQAFISAQAFDSQLNEKQEAQRTRVEYVKADAGWKVKQVGLLSLQKVK